MPYFDFSIKPKGTKRIKKDAGKYKVIEKDCEGVIIAKDGTYKVLYKNTVYSITDESFDTKGKKTIYAKWRDKYGHRIKFIRDKDNRPRAPRRLYAAICDGLVCKGKIIQPPLGGILFHIRICYNPADIEGTCLALKEWHRYKNQIENGEIDEKNEL